MTTNCTAIIIGYYWVVLFVESKLVDMLSIEDDGSTSFQPVPRPLLHFHVYRQLLHNTLLHTTIECALLFSASKYFLSTESCFKSSFFVKCPKDKPEGEQLGLFFMENCHR